MKCLRDWKISTEVVLTSVFMLQTAILAVGCRQDVRVESIKTVKTATAGLATAPRETVKM